MAEIDIPLLEDYLNEELIDDILTKSEFLKILRQQLLEKSREIFKKFLDDAFINIEFDYETQQAIVSCTLFADAGEVEVGKTESLKKLFDPNSTFFNGLVDAALDNPSVAHDMGEFFKQLSEKCFEIENDSCEENP